MRRAALAVGTIALVALGILMLRLGSGRESVRRAAPEVAARAEEPAAAVLAPAEPPPAETRAPAEATEARAEVSAERAPSATSRPAETEVPALLALAGTIVVVDEHGVAHAGEDGRFVLMLWTGNRGVWHEVDVEEGTWSTEVPLDPPLDALGVVEAWLRDRRAVYGRGDFERIALPADGWLPLEVRWPIETRLAVRDRASGRELAPVLLREEPRWPESERAHPGADAGSARDLGPSPVALPPSEHPHGGTRTFQARSPGYAWGRIEVDEDRGGEHVLLLDPAGELEIVLVGEVRDPGTRLRLYRADDELVAELAPDAETFLVEALPAGTLRVAAEIGDPWAEPLVLGATDAEVVAGRRARVTLALDAPAERVDAPLAGVLVLPRAWELAEFALHFRLLDATPLGGWEGRFSIQDDALERDAALPDHHRWSAGDVQVGRYEVALREVGFMAVLDVGPSGLTDARLEIAPPAEVRVRCLDADTGAEPEGARVMWRGAHVDGASGWTLAEARRDAALDRWICRVPLGSVTVSATAPGYDWRDEDVQVVASGQELVVELTRLACLSVVLRDGDAIVPWDRLDRPVLDAAEGQEEYDSWTTEGDAVIVLKRQPGPYRLRIPTVPGYEPVPEELVRLEKGATKEHVVALRRVR